MLLHNITTRFLQFNLWANDRLTSWLLTLPASTLYTTTGSSFGTIDGTLQHILSAEIYWNTLLTTGKINDFHQPARENAAPQVVADLVATSRDLVANVSAFNEHQLLEHITASDSRQSRYEYVLHVVNHSSYHRGQIVTMCRALGVTQDVPTTDYDAYLWWIENRS